MGLSKPHELGELRVGVQGVPVAGEPVQECLVLADGAVDGAVRFAGGCFESGGGSAVAAEAALAADEDLRVAGPQGAVRVGDLGAQDEDGGLALVVDGGDPRGGGRAALDRDGPVQFDALPAVQDVGEVDVDAGGGEAADDAHSGVGDGGEAGQDVQPGLEGVAQLVGVGGGGARAEAEVVELDVLVVPGDLGGPGFGGYGLGGVDRHQTETPCAGKTSVRPSAPSVAPRSLLGRRNSGGTPRARSRTRSSPAIPCIAKTTAVGKTPDAMSDPGCVRPGGRP